MSIAKSRLVDSGHMRIYHVYMQDEHDQVLYSWRAPLRPYRKRSTRLIRFFVALALVLSVFVLFVGDLVTLLPMWALLFLFYIFAVTPPPLVETKLTRFGIESSGILMRWDVLSHYYFVRRFGYTVLVVVTYGPYFAHSYFVVPNEQIQSELVAILAKHLMFLSSPPTTVTDRLIHLFSLLL
jgi:hypothetical protein